MKEKNLVFMDVLDIDEAITEYQSSVRYKVLRSGT